MQKASKRQVTIKNLRDSKRWELSKVGARVAVRRELVLGLVEGLAEAQPTVHATLHLRTAAEGEPALQREGFDVLGQCLSELEKDHRVSSAPEVAAVVEWLLTATERTLTYTPTDRSPTFRDFVRCLQPMARSVQQSDTVSSRRHAKRQEVVALTRTWWDGVRVGGRTTLDEFAHSAELCEWLAAKGVRVGWRDEPREDGEPEPDVSPEQIKREWLKGLKGPTQAQVDRAKGEAGVTKG